MSETLSDYMTLLDGNHLLDVPNTRTKTLLFDLPSDYVVGTSKAKVILTHRVRIPGKSSRLRVFVNPPASNNSDGFPANDQANWTLSEGYFGTLTTILHGASFKAGESNRLIFTVSGDGTQFGDIEIGDVWILYQRTIS